MELPTDTMLLVRYGVTGILGACIQITILWLWVGVLGQSGHYLWGVALGFLFALATTFPLQKYWTFRDASHRAAPRQFFWYTAIALVSLALNMLSMSLAKDFLEHMQIDFFKFWYLLAQAGIVVVVAGLSFLSNRLITFKAVGDGSL